MLEHVARRRSERHATLDLGSEVISRIPLSEAGAKRAAVELEPHPGPMDSKLRERALALWMIERELIPPCLCRQHDSHASLESR
jgi:hypothetical protein